MRILIDLQAAQTEASCGRGVGRYTEALAQAMIQERLGDQVLLAVNGVYKESAQAIARRQLLADRSASVIEYGYPHERLEDITFVPTERDAARRFAEDLVVRQWLAAQPDVLLISHVFEGMAGRSVVPRRLPRVPGLLTAAVFYDLIPLRFSDHYLADRAFRTWYESRLMTLRQFDLLLAISETSRQDGIDLLGLHPDQIVTVWGGVAEHFTPGMPEPNRAKDIAHRLGLRPSFVLYTGGDDHRKNLLGAIEAFAQLPGPLRQRSQLVIVCAIEAPRRDAYLDTARKLGLGSGDVVFTGKVSEDDLVDLYRLCTVFVFPSLYEGFGLPVVEAMSCGAPTLGGNNSSVRELIGRQDALFDATSSQSIAALMHKALTDAGYRETLRQYGQQRARDFRWNKVGSAALQAVREAHARRAGGSRAVVAVLPHRRLAVFTPLPPQRSGIADHSLLLLRHLQKYFEIDVYVDDNYVPTASDVSAALGVYRHNEFRERFQRYDTVLYEFGNSEFHAYMLPYLEEFPGVVTLHDAYLSGLFGFVQFYLGKEGVYEDEMLAAHGSRARRYLAPAARDPDPIRHSMIELPATRRVLDTAIGVLAHSPFNLQLSREHFPEGWRAPFRIVPQMVVPPRRPTLQERSQLRRSLGYGDDTFVVATFGHVTWTKMGDVLLAGFEAAAAADQRLHLVFVGEMAADKFGQDLAQAIHRSRLHQRIRVTGFLEERAFGQYVLAADMALQLRTHSRGGAPKGVLDCLGAGTPVAVNNDASYRDYPDDVVIKLPATPSASDVADCIGMFGGQPARLAPYSERGRAYVEDVHHPERVAAAYAVALNEFIGRADALSISAGVRQAVESMPVSLPDPERRTAARAIVNRHVFTAFAKTRLLIDVSHIAEKDHGTGIQRVVRSVTREMYLSPRAGVEVIAVRLETDGQLVEAVDWLASLGVLTAREAARPARTVTVRPRDTLVMLDSSWARCGQFLPVFERVRSRGGIVVTIVYDVLPVRLPQYFVEGGPAWFEAWLQEAIRQSDGLICISRAVADEVLDYVQSHPTLRTQPLKIGFWHLGVDRNDRGADNADPVAVGAVLTDFLRRPTLLMVGTLEPRKRHVLALDAFELLWKRGLDLQLLVVGKVGWMSDDLVARLRRHSESGRRLLFTESPDDAYLSCCYRQSTGLLFVSAGEGFGLPLIEAAQHGLSLLATDLPIFREVAGDNAYYVNTQTPESLADSIAGWMALWQRGVQPRSDNLGGKSWADSADELLQVLLDNVWYQQVG